MGQKKKNAVARLRSSGDYTNEHRRQRERLPPESSKHRNPHPNDPLSISQTGGQEDDLNQSHRDEHLRLKEDDYQQGKDDLRCRWEKIGFYTNHPNHNAANASEDEVKEVLQSHHRLGPIVKEYKLYVNPSKMRSLLLQFPQRENGQEYRAFTGQKPLELRIKPKCGLVELDIPMNIHDNYDKGKGIQYGQALRSSNLLQQGGSYGIAGGLGVDSRLAKEDRRAIPLEGPSPEKLLENFDDSNNKGYVMNRMTLGGMIVPFQDGDPIYMNAAFHGDECTWTKLDAMVQLRPQLSHIDALHQQDKSAGRQERLFEEERPNSPIEKEAKAVNMAVKSVENKGDDDEDMYGGMRETAKLLKLMRDEPWQRLTWVDQDEDESFEVYDENLVYQDPEKAPHLVSELSEEQYLDAISCPRIDPANQAKDPGGGGEASSVGTGIASNGEEGLEFEDSEDTETGEEVDELPPGIIRPDDTSQQMKVEVICRIICSKPAKQHSNIEVHLRKKLQGRADYRFLNIHNNYHHYYKWRLGEHRAGRGYEPERDLPESKSEVRR